MSQESSPKPKGPTRPPPPDPSRLRNLRLTPSKKVQADTCNLSLESQNIPSYIDVLSDKSSAKKHVAPARPPPPVQKRSSLSQTTETQNLNVHSETSDIRNSETSSHNGNGEATEDRPTYIDVLRNERRSLTKGVAPARPPPPVLKRSSLSQTTDTQDLNGHAEASDVRNTETSSQNGNDEATVDGPAYIDVLPNERRSLTKDVAPARPPPPVLKRSSLSQTTDTQDLNGHAETSDIRNTETSSQNRNDEATVDRPVYIHVPPNERRSLTNLATPVNAAPPRPVAPPRLSVIQSRKPLLCLSLSDVPTEHEYESIDEILSQNEDGARGLTAGLARKGRFTSYHSWSERSNDDGDSTSRELDILLEWYRSIGGLEILSMHNEEEETGTKPLISVAQRVKTAMRLYELLLVQRCTDLLNHITELHCTADRLVKSSKKARVAKLTGGTTGAVGGVAIAAGLALAPLTFGASLVATGVGIGVVAAGGVTGASASFTKKKKWTRLKEKLEKIINNYKSQIEDILACLRFIDIGMAHLRKQDDSKLKEMGAHLEKIARVAQEMENINSIDIHRECFVILQCLDSYFCEEEDPELEFRKNSNSQLAQKVHEVADRLKECMDQLLRIKKLFRSVDDNV